LRLRPLRVTKMPKDHRPRIGFGTSSANDQNFIPLRLIAIADLAPDGSPLRDGEIRLWRVDKDSFNELLQSVCPSVVLHLEDSEASGSRFTRIDIPLKDIKSFHPFSLVREVESLRKLLEGRQSLVDLRDRKLSRDQFLERLRSAPLPFLSADSISAALAARPASSTGVKPVGQTPAPRAEVSDGGGLDAILDLVDAPDDRPIGASAGTEGATRVQRFINTMFEAGGAGTPVDRRSVDGLLAEADRAMSNRLNDVLEEPQFSRLETAWRAIKFLVDRTDFREPIQIQAVAARKEDLSRVLNLLLEDAQGGTVPVAAVITDFEFDSSSRDMELLRESAGLAEQLQAPLLVNVGQEFFGKESATAA